MDAIALRIKHETINDYSFVTTDDGETFWRGCTRCGGSGHREFNGYDSICYLCNNNTSGRLGVFVGDRAAAEADATKRAKGVAARAAKRERERLAKIAKRDEAWDALRTEHPAVWEILSKAADTDSFREQREQTITERDSFVLSIANRLWALDERPLTERQIAAIQKVADKRAERAAHASETPVLTGRVEISGEILSAKRVFSDFGDVVKIVVKDDRGFRVYGSLPKASADALYEAWYEKTINVEGHSIHDFGSDCWFEVAVGARISFTAAVEASKDDVSFGFYKRPTKSTTAVA